MAPTTISYSNFDLRTQILENIRFVSWKSAKLRTLTSRDQLGNFKVIVTIDEDAGRRPFLAETGETFQKALEALHNKSADLVDRHLETVGFEHSLSKKKSPKIIDDLCDGLTSASSDGSASPTLALSEVESADETASDDDDIVSVASRASRKRTSKASIKSSRPQPGQPRPRPQSTSRVDDDTDFDRRPSPGRRPSPPQNMPPAPPRAMTLPPPPPPGWRPTVSLPPPPLPPSSMRCAAPPLPPPLARPTGVRPKLEPQQPPAGPQVQPWDMRIAINFPGHSGPRVLASMRPSKRELEQFTLSYMHKNPASFREKGFAIMTRRLSVSIARVVLGHASYDVSAYRSDDLSKLFTTAAAESSDAQMPLVEMRVVDLPPGPPPPMPRPSAPAVQPSPSPPSSPIIIMDD